MRASSRTRDLSSRREGEIERLLAHLFASARKQSASTLIRLTCKKSKAILRCDAASFWEREAAGEFVLRHREGRLLSTNVKNQLRLEEAPLLSRTLKGARAIVSNRKNLESKLAGAKVHAWNCLMTPVQPRRGSAGVLVFARKEEKSSFNRKEIIEAEAIARALGAALDSSRRDSRENRSAVAAQDPMSLASELKPSLILPEFVQDFTVRAASMLGARIAFLALCRGARLEAVFTADCDASGKAIVRAELETALTQRAYKQIGEVLEGSAQDLLGAKLCRSLGWKDLCLIRLVGRDGSLLGLLCLVDRELHVEDADRDLIHTIAAHASVALENSRLFSQIEQSKRQWVEDFDAIQDLIVVHDSGNRILRLNRSLAQVLGSRPSELVGSNVSDLRTLTKSGKGNACPFCGGADGNTDDTVLGVGGRAYLVSTSLIGPGLDENSRTIHVLKDITEQRGYQAQLKRERDFNTNILNHTQSMILVLDTAGLISYANRRCYEAGFRKNDLLGRPLTQFVSRDRRRILERAFQSTLQGSVAENLELPILYGNRNTGQYSISLSPMRDESGEVNSVVVVMTDITDARVLQAQLRHSEKMAALGQLVSGVAHEINNPLASIVGYSDLLLEDASVPEQAKEGLDIILKEAERTRDIVQNLLRFGRQMPARRERLDAEAILRQVVQLRAYGAANEGVEVVEHKNESLAQIFGDADQLQQVFLNILNNAYDAVRGQNRAGRIEISVHNHTGVVEVAIRDNGTGVPDTERIFEPFYTTKEPGQGTGLGLSICYGIVREHGGEIFCANNTDGPGCTVFVRIPVVENTVGAFVAGAAL